MTIFLGLITPLIAYAVITLLHVIIPAHRVKGYVINDATPEDGQGFESAVAMAVARAARKTMMTP